MIECMNQNKNKERLDGNDASDKWKRKKRVKRKERRAGPTEARTCEPGFLSQLAAPLMRTRGSGRRGGNKSGIEDEDAAAPITHHHLTADGE